MPYPNDPLVAAEPCPLGPGDILSGRYAIEHLVGEGTFGWVFSAVDVLESAPRRVAIKLLRQRQSSLDEGVRRFERRELALLLRVQELAPTPHVVRAQEPHVLIHEGHPYLVLEFIEGPSLREVMDTQPLTSADVQRLGEELARGLAAIHSAGGVHRDLKPTNIRLRDGKQAVILDLGINRALWDTQEFTRTGQSFMTPRYASPEQETRLNVGPESDVYSLGLILYELLTGDVPQEGEDIKAVLASQRTRGTSTSPSGEPPLPRALSACVRRCLHPNPRRRPKASAVAMHLSSEVSGRHGNGLRSRWALALAGVAALAVLGTKLLSVYSERLHPGSSDVAHPREWSRSFLYPEDLKRIGAVKADASNNVLIFGGFKGVMKFGESILTRRDSTGLFLVKLNPEGKPLWSHDLGDGSRWEWPAELAINPEGDIWIQGQFSGALDLGSGCQEMASTGKDGFLARLDAEGRCLWALQLGGEGDQTPIRLVATPDGDVIVGGFFTGQLKVSGETLVSTGPKDSFVARFSAEGSLQWMQQIKSPKPTELRSLVLRKTGIIAVTGSFEESVNLNGHLLSEKDDGSLFAATFDERGRLIFSSRLECGSALDGGRFFCQSFPDAEGFTLVKSVPSTDSRHAQPVLLARLDVEGKTRWTKKLGVCDKCYWAALTVSDGRTYVWGMVVGSMDLGDGPFSGPGGRDIFLMEFTPDGGQSQARRFSNSLDLSLNFATTDNQGDWLLVGSFAGQLDLGNSKLTSEEARSLFVAHLQRQSDEPGVRSAAGTICSPPVTDLVAWYSFEGSGLEVPSVGGTVPPGQLLRGAVLVPGRSGQVLSPNGGFFQVPDNAAFALGRGPFSISVWIRTSDADKIRLILDKVKESTGKGPKIGYQIALDRGQLVFVLGAELDSDSGIQRNDNDTVHGSGRFIADGAWHLVSVTVERNQRKGGTLYIDGEVVRQFDTTSYRGSVDADIPLRVGIRSDEASSQFRGLIDDVALWRRALSPEEVVGLYRGGRSGLCAPPGPDAGTSSDAGG